MVRRHAILGLAALLLGAGCHAGTSGGLRRQDAPVAKETISKARIIAKNNKNAATIRSLQAAPSIVVAGDGQQAKLSGQMAMDRPRDFRLKISFHHSPQADIGSNDQGFWFWVKDNKDKAIYVCDYEHIDASPLAATMQPEWIMEAMGLREIPDREAATISATPGPKPGQLVLRQLRKDAKGDTLTKVTVVDESTGEILEHRLYSGAEKDLLARATISETQHIQMEPTTADPAGSVVDFPSRIKIEWIVENFSLDITMGKPTINPDFSKIARASLFTEPTIAGAVKKDLAQLGGNAAAPSSRIYESSPRSSTGIRLGRPEAEPIGVEGASRTSRDPRPLSADLANTPAQPSGVVGAPIPRGADPEAVRASTRNGWGRPNYDQ